MDMLDISDIRVTARVYAHLAPGDLVAAVEALDLTPTGGAVSRSGFTLPETGEERVSRPELTD
jgi:hypothetical protein